MDIKELEKKFSDLSTQVDVMKKDFELKLDASKKEAESWKQNAQAREDEIKKYKEQAEKSEKDAKAARTESRRQEIKAFAEKLKRDGKITPAQEEMAVSLMESMTSEDAVMTFKEKDGSTSSHNQLSLFKKLLGSVKAQISYSEVTPHGSHDDSSPDTDGVDEKHMTIRIGNRGMVTVPVSESDIAEKAEQYIEEKRAKGIAVSYADALLAVSPKNKQS